MEHVWCQLRFAPKPVRVKKKLSAWLSSRYHYLLSDSRDAFEGMSARFLENEERNAGLCCIPISLWFYYSPIPNMKFTLLHGAGDIELGVKTKNKSSRGENAWGWVNHYDELRHQIRMRNALDGFR